MVSIVSLRTLEWERWEGKEEEEEEEEEEGRGGGGERGWRGLNNMTWSLRGSLMHVATSLGQMTWKSGDHVGFPASTSESPYRISLSDIF